jgi:hypothetical protein
MNDNPELGIRVMKRVEFVSDIMSYIGLRFLV